MGPLCSKGQFRTLNHYDSRGLSVTSVCHWGRVCVYLERPSTCLSHVLPHGHALPQTFSFCMRTTAHSSTAPWVSCGIIMQLEKFQMVPWKADLSRALPCPSFDYASVIWLAESAREWAFKGLFTLSVCTRLSAPQLISRKHVRELKKRKWNFDVDFALMCHPLTCSFSHEIQEDRTPLFNSFVLKEMQQLLKIK